MQAKKVTISCKNCGEEMTIDFNQAQFSSSLQIVNGKKHQSRTFMDNCPHCETMNTVTSENKMEWGKRKGPNIKFVMFSGLFSCLTFIVFGIVAIYFAFKGFQLVMDWFFNS
ncbi:redox protein [Solibacillus sp. R5-41]|uniref:redox protein n=1 Tax=Solibacillus sp. R5-41 TaxID=2048654 RepID=UPI000C126461|nr:redox protein [Solibacillus sp. R5-41]ATP39813.1 redox protein [Solibacillus sp. R5-41]